MSTHKRTVGVVFGSRSVEHDVSIVTAQQVMKAFDTSRYEVVPIYISRDGEWFTSEGLRDIKNFQANIKASDTIQETHLSSSTAYPGLITPPIAGRFGKSEFRKIDVMFTTIHGTHGEDGTIQGLFEMADIPYIGTGIMASAIANNKIMAKAVLKQYGIPVVEGVSFTRHEWLNDADSIMERVDELGYPAFVKPATLGSSIGIAKVDDHDRTRLHIDIAANLSRQILVERAVENATEINCAVMGYHEIEPSVLEQPVSSEVFLTYDEKYMREGGKAAGMKGADRIIPARLDDDLTAKIQDIAVRAFKAIDGYGIARIDFLVKPATGDVLLNEINTMPGSLSFYLWEESGKTAAQVIDQLIDIAMAAHGEKRQTTYNYQSKLLEHAAKTGIKGVKK